MSVEGSGRRRDGCRRDILEKVRDWPLIAGRRPALWVIW